MSQKGERGKDPRLPPLYAYGRRCWRIYIFRYRCVTNYFCGIIRKGNEEAFIISSTSITFPHSFAGNVRDATASAACCRIARSLRTWFV